MDQMRLACRACRSRKVKCSRESPKCLNCRASGQPCEYPSTILKPGPKRGSIHKRRRHERPVPLAQPESRPTSTPSDSHSPENQLLLSASSSCRPTSSKEENLVYSEHIQVVADLCQPTNEDLSPENPDLPFEPAHRNEDILSLACNELGIEQALVEQM